MMYLLITHHSSLITSLITTPISLGELSEVARPGVYALAALASAWVFGDALRREGWGVRSALAWALLTLPFPPGVLPLYLAARLFTRPASPPEPPTTQTEEESAPDESEEVASSDSSEPEPDAARVRGRRLLTVSYAAAVLLAGAVYFYVDYQSFDGRLARAERAKLHERPARAIEEYRAALRVREDVHARKLLAVQLAQVGRTEEALAEFRAAARGGDPDELIPFYIGRALEALGRVGEAAEAYGQFLQGPLCTRPRADVRCERTSARLQGLR